MWFRKPCSETVSFVTYLNYWGWSFQITRLAFCWDEFAKLRVSRAFVPLCLRIISTLLTRLTYAPCTYFSRTLRALFVHVKIVSGWISSPAETYQFSRTPGKAMKRLAYKFKHIWWKYFIQSTKTVQIQQKVVKQNITEHFKSKE